MIGAIARRLVLSALTLLLLSAFVFAATEVLPGDALDVSLSADELSMMPPARSNDSPMIRNLLSPRTPC